MLLNDVPNLGQKIPMPRVKLPAADIYDAPEMGALEEQAYAEAHNSGCNTDDLWPIDSKRLWTQEEITQAKIWAIEIVSKFRCLPWDDEVVMPNDPQS